MRQIIIEESLLKGKRRKIAEMVADGCKEKEIAEKLHLSIISVKKHISILKEEIGCNSLHGLGACMGLVLGCMGQINVRNEMGKYIITKIPN